MSRDALEQLRRDAVAERFTASTPDPARRRPAAYPLDLPDARTGRLVTWWFPVVTEPSDTPSAQRIRRAQLDLAAARMGGRR